MGPEELIHEHSGLKENRANHETTWEKIASLIWPAYRHTFTGRPLEGERKDQNIYDPTAVLALQKATAVVDSLLTPRNARWHRFTSDIDQEYMDEVLDLLFKHRYASTASFASQNHQTISSSLAFGNGVTFIDSYDEGPGFRYLSVPLGSCYFDENHQGIIDRLFRSFMFTGRQMKQKWEGDYDDKRKYEVVHATFPNKQWDRERIDSFKYSSVYLDVASKKVLSESGYSTFPYAVSRYFQSPGQVYGYGPAGTVLSSIETLNEEKKTMLRTGQKTVDPILLTHDGGILDVVSSFPGTVVPGGVNSQGRALVHALPTGSLVAGEAMMAIEQAHINDAFLINMFQILVETPTMTATEVLERTREKGILLTPSLGRQEAYLGALIEREVDLGYRNAMFPPIPREILDAGGDYEIKYESPLSRIQKTEEASGLMRTLEFGVNYALQTQDMSPLDHFNMDAIIPDLSDINAVPAKWMNDVEKIAAARDARNKQAQMDQLVAAAPALSSLAK